MCRSLRLARSARSALGAAVVLAATLAASTTAAEDAAERTPATPDAAPQDPGLARLSDGHTESSVWQPPGVKDRFGHAEVLVTAPLARVRKLVLDYGHYKELTAGKFHTSRVIGREAHGTDVYFQVQVLDGLITLWQVFRFQELKPLAPGWAMVEGWYVKGNIKAANTAWTLHAVDESHTVLRFDLLILPNVPMPQSLLDDGLRAAAAIAVESIRDNAQDKPGPLALDATTSAGTGGDAAAP
jgi:hypothetical protein